jgi:hypothetical protein
LQHYFNQSFYSCAWKINGKLSAIGGVAGSMLSPEGCVWIALTQEALKFPLAIIKEIKKQLNLILKNKSKLIAFILTQDLPAIRFAEFLGFSYQETIDEDFLVYTLI